MTDVCAWCQQPVTPDSSGGEVFAGLCPECARRSQEDRPVALSDLVNEFPVPVLAVDDDVAVLAANDAARTAFNLTPVEMTGRRVGDIVECVHAREPGGCGRTIHCTGCAFRRTVEATAADGISRHDVPALQSIHTSQGVRLKSFRISTQVVGKFVLVTIGSGPARPPRRRPGRIAAGGDRRASDWADPAELL